MSMCRFAVPVMALNAWAEQRSPFEGAEGDGAGSRHPQVLPVPRSPVIENASIESTVERRPGVHDEGDWKIGCGPEGRPMD